MTRIKKQKRMANKIVLDKTPKKQERLADPDSYESRKRRALLKKKRNRSVEQKREDAQRKATQSSTDRDREAGRRGEKQGGRLAEKIRQLNAKEPETDASEPDSSNG